MSSAASVHIVRCHIAEACIGGITSACGDGYEGNRCGRCADGWYMYSRLCACCGADAAVYALAGIAAFVAVSLPCFVLWQLMLDPRVASSFVFLMRLMETLAILQQTSIEWAPAVRSVFAALSVVNFNTEIFRLECWLGRSKPIQQAATVGCAPFAAFGVFLAARPLLRPVAAWWASKHQDGRKKTVAEMLAHFQPDASAKDRSSPLGFRPIDALAAASWTEYLRMVSTVPASIRVNRDSSVAITFRHNAGEALLSRALMLQNVTGLLQSLDLRLPALVRCCGTVCKRMCASLRAFMPADCLGAKPSPVF